MRIRVKLIKQEFENSVVERITKV